MASWLAKRGHEVRVVTAPPYYPEWRRAKGYRSWRFYREVWNGCSVWRSPLWVPAKPTALTRILHLLSFAASSLAVMIRQTFWRPDLVFVLEPPLFCAPAALLVARLTGAIAWLHVQDFEVAAFFGLGFARAGAFKGILVSIERWLTRRFDSVSTISRSMRDRIFRLGVPPEGTSLFPNWVDTERIRPDEPADALLRSWGLAEDRKIVLYAGNMGKKQGLGIVLDVAAALQSSRPDILFVLVGDGADRDELVARARRDKLGNVVFKPVQPLPTLPALLNLAAVHLVVQRRGAADAVMPSKLTGILAAGGAALITADAESELGRFVEENPGIAVRVEPENPEALLSELVSLADDEGRRRSCGSAARAYAVSNLSIDAVLPAFEARAESLVKHLNTDGLPLKKNENIS